MPTPFFEDRPGAPRETGRLLIVDDNSDNCDLLARRLQQIGHACVSVHSGVQALERLAAEDFDLILLDIMMPIMDGFAVLEAIKADPRFRHLPVIMISALSETDPVVRCLELGAADYLPKPFNPTLLRARVGNCLREKRLRDRERRIADALQRPLIQPIAPDAFAGLSLWTLYEAAWSEAQIGGDLFDAFALPGGRVALAVADASGKGLAAAVRVMQVKYALRALAHEHPDNLPAILSGLNTLLCRAQEFDGEASESFVCLGLAVVHPADGQGMLLTAGCEPPLIRRADGTVETAATPGLPLGVLDGASWEARPLALGGGEALLLYTDGLSEARRGGDFLGAEGVAALAADAAPSDSPEAVATRVLEGARAFGGALRDDACLLLAQRTAP